MPDSKPNLLRVELLKEWLEDLLKPGYVNQRIESLKKAIFKKNNGSEVRVLIKPTKQSIIQALVQEKFRYRFLDVTSTAVSEEQVCSDFNFNIVVSYCSSFAEELPTKKEVEAMLNQGLEKAEKEATDSGVKGASHEKLAILKQDAKMTTAADNDKQAREDAQEDAADACGMDEGAEAGEEEAGEEDDCLGDDLEKALKQRAKEGEEGKAGEEASEEPRSPDSVPEKKAKGRGRGRGKGKGKGKQVLKRPAAREQPNEEEMDDQEEHEQEEANEEPEEGEEAEQTQVLKRPAAREANEKPAKKAKGDQEEADDQEQDQQEMKRPRKERKPSSPPRGALSRQSKETKEAVSARSWTITLDSNKSKIGAVNRKGGASLGWTKFESLTEAPGGKHRAKRPIGDVKDAWVSPIAF
eukprot:s2614_g2.t2